MRAVPAGLIAAMLTFAPPAGAAKDVNANGNAFTGGLGFSPGEVAVSAGEVVRWRNTDPYVPHTSTERHGLWDLAGSYGATPVTPPGYGPGAVVERRFEAGTHRYYCRVHPRDMTGTIAVPVTLSRERVRLKRKRPRKRKRFKRVAFISAVWAGGPPAEGLVYDVERRVGVATPWEPLRTGTRQPSVRFRAGIRGTPWELRARLRRDGSQEATDWSPVAAITG